MEEAVCKLEIKCQVRANNEERMITELLVMLLDNIFLGNKILVSDQNCLTNCSHQKKRGKMEATREGWY